MYNIQFNGLQAVLQRIVAPTRWAGAYTWDSDSYIYAHRNDPYELIFTTYANSVDELSNIWRLLKYSNWYTLGDGQVCKYCGAYNPDGRVACWYCGGECVTLPMSRVEETPIICDSISAPEPFYDKYTEMFVHFTLRHYGPLPVDRNGVVSFPLFNNYVTNYRLCEFCGTVFNNKACPNCGGQQFPLSEIVKMDRHCLYCGSKVVGNVICKGCGRSIAGMSIKEQLLQ